MKKTKLSNLLLPNFYFELNTIQVSHNTLLSLIQKRIKILKMVEDGICDLSLLDLSKENDILSHFLLRMVCSQIDWVYNLFIKLEANFFKLKLEKIENLENYFRESLKKFRKVEVVDEEVYLTRKSYIDGDEGVYDQESINNPFNNKHNKSLIYVHWSKLCSVFGKRLVEVKGGYCLLTNIDTILVNEFKAHLKRKVCPKGDSRLIKICRDLFVEKKKVNNIDFNLGDMKFYPPCILSILNELNNGHLKYNDRQALTLFFKEIGMSVEKCLEFFSSKFKVLKSDYSYSIRHNYGLVGKKADYGCYSCQKMAYNKSTSNLSGCPYVDNQDFVLKTLKLDIEDLGDGSPTGKCTRVLEKLTKEEYNKNVTTPVKYFMMYKKGVSKLN